jgi:hypothetical protein
MRNMAIPANHLPSKSVLMESTQHYAAIDNTACNAVWYYGFADSCKIQDSLLPCTVWHDTTRIWMSKQHPRYCWIHWWRATPISAPNAAKTPTKGPATQVKNLTGSQVAVKVSKYISCFCSQISLSFQCKSSIWNCKSVSKRQFANLWKRQSTKLENQTKNKQTPCKQCCCLPWFH